MGFDINDELPTIEDPIVKYYLHKDAHPFARANFAITPYLMKEHLWSWSFNSIDNDWERDTLMFSVSFSFEKINSDCLIP